MGGGLILGGYHVCAGGESLGRASDAPPRSRISPYFDDGQIEFYTLRRSSVVPYRLLFRQAPPDPNQPPVFASARSTAPGLAFPFFEFNDPAAARETRRCGLEPPVLHAPYSIFPERRAARRPARPHLQPAIADWTVRPGSGWLDWEPASPSESSPVTPGSGVAGAGGRGPGGRGRCKGCWTGCATVSGLWCGCSRRCCRGSGRRPAARRGRCRGPILARLGLVESEEDPLFDQVWRHLSPGGGALPAQELDRRFGISEDTQAIIVMLRQRVRPATGRQCTGRSRTACI